LARHRGRNFSVLAIWRPDRLRKVFLQCSRTRRRRMGIGKHSEESSSTNFELEFTRPRWISNLKRTTWNRKFNEKYIKINFDKRLSLSRRFYSYQCLVRKHVQRVYIFQVKIPIWFVGGILSH
uniref:THAP-type domain-containing protein n=1 Tax=Haemonchus placei TaxID=6290 RepID=A0A158QKM1_HAEPC